MKTRTNTFFITVLSTCLVASIAVPSALAKDKITQKEFLKVKAKYEAAQKAVLDSAPKDKKVKFKEDVYDQSIKSANEAKAEMDKVNKDPKSTKSDKNIAKMNYEDKVETVKANHPGKGGDHIYRNALKTLRIRDMQYTEALNKERVYPKSEFDSSWSGDLKLRDPLAGLTLDYGLKLPNIGLQNLETGTLGAELGFVVGYDGNIYGSPDHSDESTFLGLDLNLGYKLTDDWQINLGVNSRLYDDITWSRPDGSDDFINSYSFSSRYSRQLNDRFFYTHEANVVHGGLGSIHYNDTTRGILERDRTYITTDANLFYRPDGQDLETPGYYARLGYATTHYNQSGEGEFDVDDGTLGLGITGVINPNLSIFGGIAHRERDWFNMDYNSDGYFVEAGARGQFPCGVDYEISLNNETRDYKNRYLDDEDQFGYALKVSGQIDDRTRWGLRSTYGFQDPNISSNRDNDLIDAHGKLFGAFISRDLGNDYFATLFCTALLLEGHIFNSTDLETQHIINGLRIDKKINEGTDASLILGHQKVKYEYANTSETEDSFYGGFSVRVRF